MTIIARTRIHFALIRSLAGGASEDEAVAQVAAELCIAEEAVREVIAQLTEEAEHG